MSLFICYCYYLFFSKRSMKNTRLPARYVSGNSWMNSLSAAGEINRQWIKILTFPRAPFISQPVSPSSQKKEQMTTRKKKKKKKKTKKKKKKKKRRPVSVAGRAPASIPPNSIPPLSSRVQGTKCSAHAGYYVAPVYSVAVCPPSSSSSFIPLSPLWR